MSKTDILKQPDNEQARNIIDNFCNVLDLWYIETQDRLKDSGSHSLGVQKESIKNLVCGIITGFTDKWEATARDYESRILGK